MNAKKMIGLAVALIGQVLIIAGFLHFGEGMDPYKGGLNTVVTSIIYWMFFIDLFIPVLDLKERSSRKVGSLGIRWVFTILFAICAIGAMLFFGQVKDADFIAQVIIHSGLLFLFMIGMYLSFYAGQRVLEVHNEQQEASNGVEDMRLSIKEVKRKVEDMKTVPLDLINRVLSLEENMRFLTPSDNHQARSLEMSFVTEMRNVKEALFNVPFSHEEVAEKLRLCERTYDDRKKVYSN